jgi:hypothetical protein
MKYDLIIVAKSSRTELIRITQACIDSALPDGTGVNIILIETGPSHEYANVNQTIQYKGSFNYNHALNQGLQCATGDIHILANNDLIFYPGWPKIGQQMIDNGFDSACALSNDPRQRIYEQGDFIYPGYEIGRHIGGWCIFVTRACIEKIGKLDETYDFWYSDNAYADQLQSIGIKHGLFCNVRVDHITSVTLRTIPPREQRKYSFGAKTKYDTNHAMRKGIE